MKPICGCDEYRQLSRRKFLGTAGWFGAGSFFGLLNPRLLFGAAGPNAIADSVIMLWMGGGMSHLDTWDPKPGTDSGGPFKTVKTTSDGIEISEHLPLTAKQFKHLSLIRSLTSHEGSHERATYQMHTGYPPIGSFQHATLGSVVTKMKPKINPDLPAYVSIGGQTWPAGFIGSAYAPFHIAIPTEPTQNIAYHQGVDGTRFGNRLTLLGELDKSFAESHRGVDAMKAYAEHYMSALKMMKSPTVSAFNLEYEKPQVREQYGKDAFGQGCLLARRLVQVGVRFVEVTLGGWDTHQNNFESVKKLSGNVDHAVSTLITDLHAKGLLDRTLVLLTSEFGRTPKINGQQGRDHWPRAWSCVIGGGGIKGGRLIGKTDAGGSEVADRPVKIGELHATICKALAIDSTDVNYSSDGRPIRIVQDKEAKPIADLFA